MKRKLKFGLYTSFYNCEEFVRRAFNNAELIPYDNFEWHIADDFSIDGTKDAILECLANSTISDKIKLYNQKFKKHMYWKPNEFFDETFDWIITIDADDEFDPIFLDLYNRVLINMDDISVVSSDCHKIESDTNKLHSISYILNDELFSSKINRYHPNCDYLNNISYSSFGHLRGYKNVKTNPIIDDYTACADDSYRVMWYNSYGKYLHIPRVLYKWNIRSDSESHSKNMPDNFNANFDIALNKLKESDYGVDTTFNDVYLETCALGSYDFGKLNGNKISLWTKSLTDDQKEKLTNLYFDCILSYDDIDADIHIVCLNHFTDKTMDKIIDDTKGKSVLFYYQNQNKHFSHEDKDEELNRQLNHYRILIGNKVGGLYWWSYIRHFIIIHNV